MRCRRTSEIDFEGFLLDAGAFEFEAFRSHYPDCADCAAAVARWTALDLALRDVFEDGVGAGAHPEPELLETFLASPEAIGESAMQLERHLTACPTCRAEITLMRRFDPAELLAGPVDAPALQALREEGGIGAVVRRLFDSILETLFAPGFARAAVPSMLAAALLTAGLWWSGSLLGQSGSDSGADSTRVVEVQPSPPPPPLQDPPGAEAAGSGRPVVADSQKAEAPLDAERLALETPQDVSPRILERRSEIPIELAEASPQVGESPRAPSPTPRGNPTSDPLDSAPLEEILLAALTDLPLPDYAPPAGAGSLGWMRQFGPVRSGVTSYRVETRAPADHAGLTLDESPRLWWFVAEAIDLPLQVTLVDEEAIDPLLQIELPGPHGPGLQSIDLEEHGIRLEPETEYRWFVSVLVDPNRPSRNPASAGALRVIGDSDERRRGIEETAASARGHTLARLGIWYDAYDFFASLAAAHPQIEGLAAHRDRLVEMAAAGR